MVANADLYFDPAPAVLRNEAARRHAAWIANDTRFREAHAKGLLTDEQVDTIEGVIRGKIAEAAWLSQIADYNDEDHRKYDLWLLSGGNLCDPTLWPKVYRDIGSGKTEPPLWMTDPELLRVLFRTAEAVALNLDVKDPVEALRHIFPAKASQPEHKE